LAAEANQFRVWPVVPSFFLARMASVFGTARSPLSALRYVLQNRARADEGVEDVGERVLPHADPDADVCSRPGCGLLPAWLAYQSAYPS
jgi:hypothetical protein